MLLGGPSFELNSVAKETEMKKSRYNQEHIFAVLKQHQAGVPTAELCRKHGIRDATSYTGGRAMVG